MDAQTILKSFLHPEASVKNRRLDMTAAATVADSARTIRTIADVPGVDSLLILFRTTHRNLSRGNLERDSRNREGN